MRIMETPWGPSRFIEPATGPNGEDEGVVFVATRRHGGYKVPPELNQRIIDKFISTHISRSDWSADMQLGWYEEDCHWCYVCLTFPDLFPAAAHVAAADMLFWLSKENRKEE